jgi:hypothetical protein
MLSAKLARVVLVGATVTACAGLVLTALIHIQRGEGAQVYQTYWGAFVHWTSPVVFFGALALAAVVAFILRWWEHRQQRRLERDVAAKLSATKGSRRGV